MNEMAALKSSNPLPSVEEFSKWSPEQLTSSLQASGVPIGDRFIIHRIDGSLVGMMADKDYETLGFDALGDMLRVKRAIAVLQKQIKGHQRDAIIWESESYQDKSCLSKCSIRCCCPADQSDKYKLTGSNLQVIEHSRASKNPCLACCYPTARSVDNIALASIKDVDVNMQKPSCISATFCCLKGRAEVMLSHSGADVDNDATTLYLAADDGIKVQKIIRDAVSENISRI